MHGLAAEWLFEDVKATWLYGYFTGTVLTAYAFCVQQLAGLLRMNSDDAEYPARQRHWRPWLRRPSSAIWSISTSGRTSSRCTTPPPRT